MRVFSIFFKKYIKACLFCVIMKIDLNKRPKNPTIIEGFAGLGLVSTIATEFLIKHLNAKRIGNVSSKKLTPIAAIHQKELIEPLEIYYDEKHNIIILRALTEISGIEWDIAESIEDLAKELNAKEIISIEGIKGQGEKPEIFFYTNSKEKNKGLVKLAKELDNGIVIGVTGALVLGLKKSKIPFSCIFAETQPALPGSKAAGEIVKILDKYLGLKIDCKPLMETAEDFEKKLKEIMEKAGEVADKKKSKKAKEEGKKESYLG